MKGMVILTPKSGMVYRIFLRMALGATWETENARLVGTVVGHATFRPWESICFGPSLDVVDNPRPTGATLWGLAPLAAILTGWARWGGLC